MSPSQSETLQWTIELARAAGTRLLDWFGNVTAERKSDGTLVTQADTEVDQFLSERVRASYPRDEIISEELHSNYTGDASATATWVFDPLDGTTNFANGLPIWGISIARLKDGHPQLGVLYFPMIDEMLHVERGKGAYLNGERFRAPNADKMEWNDVFACDALVLKRYDVGHHGKTRVLGAAAFDLVSVATGRARALLLARPKLWDVAAGWLLVEEAGAVIEALDNKVPFPLQLDKDYAIESFPLVAAVSPAIHATIRANIRLVSQKQ